VIARPAVRSPEGEGLGAVLRDFQREGFVGNLRVAGPDVACGTCGSVLRPADLLVHRLRRLEGASDPDDMLAVVGASCRGCGTDGTLVLGYGPAADPLDAAVLAGLVIPEAVPTGSPIGRPGA
jgi:hypothetical protein